MLIMMNRNIKAQYFHFYLVFFKRQVDNQIKNALDFVVGIFFARTPSGGCFRFLWVVLYFSLCSADSKNVRISTRTSL